MCHGCVERRVQRLHRLLGTPAVGVQIAGKTTPCRADLGEGRVEPEAEDGERVLPRLVHRPWKFGVRFSMNAATPSRKSCVRISGSNWRNT